jgi:hypothetical protein
MWEQAPDGEHVDQCQQDDPCFWEYFVPNADAFLTDNLNKALKMANGTNCRYHSIVLSSKLQMEFIVVKLNNFQQAVLSAWTIRPLPSIFV